MKPIAKLILVAAILAAPPTKAAKAASEPEVGRECVAFYASVYGVPADLVDAVIQVESAWNPYAISSKGAEGLMQLMPATAIRFGVRNRFDVEENVRGGVTYLAWLIRLFRGDLRLVVAAYYVGESAILLRGLAYSSEDVFRYVTRVAEAYRTLRLEARTDSWTPAARVPAGGTQ